MHVGYVYAIAGPTLMESGVRRMEKPKDPEASAEPDVPVQSGSTRVLAIDSEAQNLRALTPFLADYGYDVEVVVDGADAMTRFVESQPHIVLLAMRLPGYSGLDLLRAIRGRSEVPVIVIGDHPDEADCIVALELGADEFLTAPFSKRELTAHIGALLRRTRGTCGRERGLLPTGSRYETITIDRSNHEARQGGTILQLTPTEYRILDVLDSHANEALSRGRLLELLAADSSVSDRTIDKHIANLRKKIEINPAHPTHLLTIFGVGYRFQK